MCKTIKRITLILMVICCFSGCTHNKYTPDHYTKIEIHNMLKNYEPLFRELVFVVSTNQKFYDEGRVSQFTDADIVSPNDEALNCFDEQQRAVIQNFFRFHPYMISLDYAKRFVAVSFLSTDINNAYTVVFWIESDTNTVERLNEYSELLSQDFTVEKVKNDCLLYFR